MKLLTRIRLVNWHLFENTTVNCQGTTYFIGINGAGKSTILDAVQFALVGGQRDVRFNQAAVSGSKRTLASYVRGELGTEGQRYLRGLFSGGTLQYEALLILQNYVPVVYSNAPLDKKNKLEDSLVSKAHTVIDLGEDEFTVGRLHPMLDNDLRIRRLEKEASDPEVAVILLDVVLGYGAHGDPASELAPAIAAAIQSAKEAGRHLEVVAIVSGTDGDPQGIEAQIKQLRDAGAKTETSNDAAARYVGRLLQAIERASQPGTAPTMKPVDLQALKQPLAGINVGLESFADSLRAQGAQAVHVDWKPVAGSNERLVSILERMRQAQ